MRIQVFYRRIGMNEEWLHADEKWLAYLPCLRSQDA